MSQTDIEEYRYLWEQDQWGLIAHHFPRTAVKIVFPTDRPSPEQLLAVRKLVDRFRDMPAQQLKAEIGNSRELDLGIMSPKEVWRKFQKASELKLDVKGEDVSYTRYVPINQQTQTTVVIEDEELAERVVIRMLEAGREVVGQVEYD